MIIFLRALFVVVIASMLAVTTWIAAGPARKPMRQPVTEYVLLNEFIVSVRSASPGTLAGETCLRPSKHMYS